jgi:type I restriction enzyme S subunit
MLPPFPEQKRIVTKIEELFSDLDAAVEALKKAQAQLKRYRQSVLKTAFEGKLTEAWRRKNNDELEPASILLAQIQEERRTAFGKKYKQPAPVDTTGLPELPKGWAWANIGQVSEIDVGFAFRSHEFVNSGIRLLRGENLEPGALRWEDVKFWPTDRVSEYEHLLVRQGDIILAMDRPLISTGLKIARARKCDIPCLLVQRMARFRFVDERMVGFVYYMLQTHEFIRHCLGKQTGTQLPHISGGQIAAFVLPMPPLAEQDQILQNIESRFSLAEKAEEIIDQSLKQASRLRQSILKRAFEGKLVPQNPKDEPAEKLLERIKAEKAKIESENKGKRATKKPKE